MEIYQKTENVLAHRVLSNAVAVTVGMALKMGAGGLVKCGVADKPEYISNAEMTGDGTATVPVQEITCDTVCAAPLGAAASSLAIGQKVKLHTDIVRITGTTGGCCQVVGFDGKAAGDRVLFKVVSADAVTA